MSKINLKKVDYSEHTYCYNCGVHNHIRVNIQDDIICSSCGSLIKCNSEITDHLLKQINEYVDAFYKCGGVCEIDDTFGYMSITHTCGEEWYFDGSDFDNMKDQVPLNVSMEDFYIWSSMGW